MPATAVTVLMPVYNGAGRTAEVMPCCSARRFELLV
jgi:hypothetical protein